AGRRPGTREGGAALRLWRGGVARALADAERSRVGIVEVRRSRRRQIGLTRIVGPEGRGVANGMRALDLGGGAREPRGGGRARRGEEQRGSSAPLHTLRCSSDEVGCQGTSGPM